jgi:hypothetical protein
VNNVVHRFYWGRCGGVHAVCDVLATIVCQLAFFLLKTFKVSLNGINTITAEGICGSRIIQENVSLKIIFVFCLVGVAEGHEPI